MVSVFQETWNEGEAAMAEFIKLPVGIDNFEKIRRDGFYYVDKTSLTVIMKHSMSYQTDVDA